MDQVVSAAKGMDAIINLSVLRPDRKLAFDVNARGCYNTMAAAVEHGIGRIINSGPFYAVAGPTYERFDHQIKPEQMNLILAFNWVAPSTVVVVINPEACPPDDALR